MNTIKSISSLLIKGLVEVLLTLGMFAVCLLGLAVVIASLWLTTTLKPFWVATLIALVINGSLWGAIIKGKENGYWTMIGEAGVDVGKAFFLAANLLSLVINYNH